MAKLTTRFRRSATHHGPIPDPAATEVTGDV